MTGHAPPAVRPRRRKTGAPCPRCALHRERCICAQIPSLTLRTRLTLLIHHRELKRTTNTGRLATLALKNSALFVRGRKDDAIGMDEVLPPAFDAVLLYPGEDAVPLEDFRASRPVNLIVPDGNWRQAGKVHRRHPGLLDLPRVKFTERNTNVHHLRREHFAAGRSTLEAIALAFRILEGPEVGDRLHQLYLAKLTATLAGRGQLGGTTFAPTNP